MKRVSSTVSLLLLLCVVSIWAIPVKRDSAKHKKNVLLKPKKQFQLREQETELKNLAKLQNEKSDNVLLQTTKDVKVVQDNGKSEKTVKTSKNVVDADIGDVLSSVEQTIKAENKENETPKVSAVTKVDIPSEGIHKIFTDNDVNEGEKPLKDENVAEKKNIPSIVSGDKSEDSEESSLDEDIKDLQKSSTVMANYLLETGNFERFENALQDIVKVGLMTVSEANEYEKIVLAKYEKMMAHQKMKEYQAAQSPLDYAERDYDIPYQMNNEMESEDAADNSINARQYITRRRGMLPPPTRGYTGQEYTDYSDPIQAYNGYPEVDDTQDRSQEWLNELVEQANGADKRQPYSEFYSGNTRMPVDQDRMRRIVQEIFDSDDFPKTFSPLDSPREMENYDGEVKMVPDSAEGYEDNLSEEPALKALAKMNTPAARQVVVKSPAKHPAKKQTATDKKKKSA